MLQHTTHPTEQKISFWILYFLFTGARFHISVESCSRAYSLNRQASSDFIKDIFFVPTSTT